MSSVKIYKDLEIILQIRKAVHVGDQEFSSSYLVYFNLIPDFMSTAMHWTETLLNEGLRIMYYR